jgi:hypothetical protein
VQTFHPAELEFPYPNHYSHNQPFQKTSYEGFVADDGQVDKLGCFAFADGDVYEGHFLDGEMHGFGAYSWGHDKSSYFGKWDNNQQSGCGVKFFANGSVEFGEWKEDQYLGQYTGVCGAQESYGAMNNAIDVAQRARMFKYKPDSEVTLQKNGFTMHQDPIVYQSGTEWQMPGWRGEMYPAPSAEELEKNHPRLYAQMQRHNEIWERAWRYYNLDLQDALAFGIEKRAKDAAAAEQDALTASLAPEAQEDYDEYGEYDEEVTTETKKKKKSSSGGKKKTVGPASLTLSLRGAGLAVERAFASASRAALRRPEIAAFAERRAQKRAERETRKNEGQRNSGPFASLSLSLPFGR